MKNSTTQEQSPPKYERCPLISVLVWFTRKFPLDTTTLHNRNNKSLISLKQKRVTDITQTVQFTVPGLSTHCSVHLWVITYSSRWEDEKLRMWSCDDGGRRTVCPMEECCWVWVTSPHRPEGAYCRWSSCPEHLRVPSPSSGTALSDNAT